jgi:hypothetical protein
MQLVHRIIYWISGYRGEKIVVQSYFCGRIGNSLSSLNRLRGVMADRLLVPRAAWLASLSHASHVAPPVGKNRARALTLPSLSHSLGLPPSLSYSPISIDNSTVQQPTAAIAPSSIFHYWPHPCSSSRASPPSHAFGRRHGQDRL